MKTASNLEGVISRKPKQKQSVFQSTPKITYANQFVRQDRPGAEFTSEIGSGLKANTANALSPKENLLN